MCQTILNYGTLDIKIHSTIFPYFLKGFILKRPKTMSHQSKAK